MGRHAPIPAVRRRADRAELEHTVGCAVYTLVLSGRELSDALIPDVMELSGADMATAFAVVDQLIDALRRSERPGAR